MNKEYFPWIISGLALIVSATSALISYFSYHLNKSLIIRNNIYQEKVKLYRELTKAIASLILFLQDSELDIEVPIQSKDKIKLDIISSEIENKSSNIDYLILESYMLISEPIFSIMKEFSNIISEIRPLHVNFITLTKYNEIVKKTKAQGEFLILEFRKDLQIEEINKNLVRI